MRKSYHLSLTQLGRKSIGSALRLLIISLILVWKYFPISWFLSLSSSEVAARPRPIIVVSNLKRSCDKRTRSTWALVSSSCLFHYHHTTLAEDSGAPAGTLLDYQCNVVTFEDAWGEDPWECHCTARREDANLDILKIQSASPPLLVSHVDVVLYRDVLVRTSLLGHNAVGSASRQKSCWTYSGNATPNEDKNQMSC